MPNPVEFKKTQHSEWEPWFYLAPTGPTLEILLRESQANFPRAIRRYAQEKKKGIKAILPTPHCLFYGEKIWGFKFKKTGKEWNVEKGWVK